MKKHNDGSTLIEVMVATCILVFVGVIFASGFYTVVKLVSDGNQVQKATDEMSSVIQGDKNPNVEVVKSKIDVSFKIKGKDTPIIKHGIKGVYSSKTSSDVNLVSIIDNNQRLYDYKVELKMYKDMKEMPETRRKMTTEQQIQYGISWPGNTYFANYLYKYVYNSNFPQLNEGFVDQIKKINPTETGPFYIQPFTGTNFVPYGLNSTTVVFAIKSDKSGTWYTNLVFHQDDNAWYYSQKGVTLTDFNSYLSSGAQQLSWAQFTQQLHSGSDGWVKLDDIYY
ncbi:MAG: hypothetical protein RSF69_03205 [Erysipelotrichaceae bacterium]